MGPFDFDAAPGPAPSAFSSESDLLTRWEGPLRTFWDAGEAGDFSGVGGVKVAYRIFRVPNPKAAVVITPGRTEAIIKYAEVARDLTAQGYSVYALTLRGQGEAARILSDRDKGYVDFFDDYVEDDHTFISTIVKPEVSKVFLLAHSLSGGVATLLIDEHPEDVQAFVTTSPMLDINLGAFPPPVAATLAGGICDSTDGSGYIIGGGPYSKEQDFEKNSVTHSRARFDWKIGQLDADETIRMGGPTWRWLCQALVGSSRGQGVGRFSSVPTVVFIAAQDTIVKPGGQQRYCADAPLCTLSQLEGAKHEILQESDELRNLALSRIVKFFDAQAGATP
ncbi:MAG: alpha/beta fold hydrolase [Archangium sp.]|nr:alpha/beta fold hydrolase [Archangium sp.]